MTPEITPGRFGNRCPSQDRTADPAAPRFAERWALRKNCGAPWVSCPMPRAAFPTLPVDRRSRRKSAQPRGTGKGPARLHRNAGNPAGGGFIGQRPGRRGRRVKSSTFDGRGTRHERSRRSPDRNHDGAGLPRPDRPGDCQGGESGGNHRRSTGTAAHPDGPGKCPVVVPTPEPAKLQGPVVDPENTPDIVTDQSQVDDLLASLGF